MTISRRSFLAGAALAASSPAFASADVDVAVVGAGAAGLAAAKRLRQAGRSFVVLEARSRIGGRAFTDASLGVPFDAGAQFIHWAERNPWRTIARDLGVGLYEDELGGVPLVFRDGAPLSEQERMRRRGAFGRVWSLIEGAEGEDRSVAEVAEGGGAVRDAAGGITLLSLGEDPERVSVRDYQQLWSGDDDLVTGGYGALVARYGADVPVRLTTPVTAIAWDGPGVVIETPQGSVRARAAIVTVPVGVLAAGRIRFSPSLPASAERALDGLRMGALTKVALKLDRARLGALPATDYIELGERGAITMIEFWPRRQDIAIATLGGDHAREVCALGEAGAVDHMVARLVAMVGGQVRGAVVGGRLAGWWTDPFSQGSYSIARPGQAEARAALQAPVGERIWLAGEATAGGGAMTVGGATLEGERAAGAVLQRL